MRLGVRVCLFPLAFPFFSTKSRSRQIGGDLAADPFPGHPLLHRGIPHFLLLDFHPIPPCLSPVRSNSASNGEREMEARALCSPECTVRFRGFTRGPQFSVVCRHFYSWLFRSGPAPSVLPPLPLLAGDAAAASAGLLFTQIILLSSLLLHPHGRLGGSLKAIAAEI